MSLSLPVESSISNELLPDEEVLWSGSPDPKSKGAVSSSRLIMAGWIQTMLGLLLLILTFSLLQGYPSPLVTVMIVIGTFSFIVGLLCLRLGFSTRFSSQKMFYAITNRRVMILCRGRYLLVTSYSKRAITQIQRVERSDGLSDLIIVAGSTSNVVSNRQNTLMAIPNLRQVEHKLITLLNEQ